MSVYSRQPRDWFEDIPVFSTASAYSKNYDDIAQDHLHHLAAHGRSPFMSEHQINESNKATTDLVKRHVGKGGKILDAGVGMGKMWEGISDYSLFGVDIANEYLKIAKTCGIEVANAVISDLPYDDATFDAITTCDVLEHLLDLDASVRELSRVLKPGGLLIIRVPNNEDLASYVEYKEYEFVHVRTFSASSLRLYMEKCAGYSHVETGFCAAGLYTHKQLVNPAVPRESELRKILPRLRARNTPEQGLSRFWKKAPPDPVAAAYETLEKGLALAFEDQVEALKTLQDRDVDGFFELSKSVVHPMELLGVYRRGDGRAGGEA